MRRHKASPRCPAHTNRQFSKNDTFIHVRRHCSRDCCAVLLLPRVLSTRASPMQRSPHTRQPRFVAPSSWVWWGLHVMGRS